MLKELVGLLFKFVTVHRLLFDAITLEVKSIDTNDACLHPWKAIAQYLNDRSKST